MGTGRCEESLVPKLGAINPTLHSAKSFPFSLVGAQFIAPACGILAEVVFHSFLAARAVHIGLRGFRPGRRTFSPPRVGF